MNNNSVEDRYQGISPRNSRRLRAMLLLAIMLFLVGISTPMITVTKLIWFKNSFSVLSGVIELLRNGQFILFILIAGFSIVLPLLKIWILWQLSSANSIPGHQTRRLLNLMHDYGRWAMLDVMVVAIMIMTVKLGAIASVQVHYGLYVFGAAVLCIMMITHWATKLTSNIPGK